MSQVNQSNNRHQLGNLTQISQTEHYFQMQFSTGETGRLYLLSPQIIRLVIDPSGQFEPVEPQLTVPLDQFDDRFFEQAKLLLTDEAAIIKSGLLNLRIQRRPALFSIFDEGLHRNRLAQISPLELTNESSSEFLQQSQNEFYYGGGMQNGRFSHKGHTIAIKNTNLTGSGGVAAPMSFFWSNAGYGELRNTWQPGRYDFGASQGQAVALTHEDNIFDAFYLLGDTPQAILAAYYQVTGRPVLMPEFALGLGQMSNLTDFYWEKTKPQERAARKFSDGNYYLPSSKPTEQAASLTGDDPFSAKQLISDYQEAHLPLGWLVPDFLSKKTGEPADIASLNEFASQHDVHLLLNGPERRGTSGLILPSADARPGSARLFLALGQSRQALLDQQRQRPFLLSENGWAGTQSLAANFELGAGGDWSYIRTNVASMLGLSLSGQPNTGFAIDGAYGGSNVQVALRDLEWKAFTPLCFFADGQSQVAKTALAFNKKTMRIMAAYLKLREHLSQHLYSLMLQAQTGQPFMRALFLDFPHERVNYTDRFAHEFMVGSDLLVAPIMSGRENQAGQSVKSNLYLPDHRAVWTDLLTGQHYAGGHVYNNLLFDNWHLPVFARGGSILATGQQEFLCYPGSSERIFCRDDGHTIAYQAGAQTKQTLTSSLAGRNFNLVLGKVAGDYAGFDHNQAPQLNILMDHQPGKISLRANNELIALPVFSDADAFANAKTGCFFNADFCPFPEFKHWGVAAQPALQIKLPQSDLTQTKFELTVANVEFGAQIQHHAITDSALRSPQKVTIDADKTTAHSLTLNWTTKPGSQIQLEVNGLLYTNLPADFFTLHELKPKTNYQMRIRTWRGMKVSPWSEYFAATTKPDQLDYAIANIQAEANLPAAPQHPLTYLTDLLKASDWLTDEPADPEHEKYLELTFKFDQAYRLSRMVYVPRSIDRRGHLLRVQIAWSKDGQNFTDYSDAYNWPNDAKNKVIGLRDVVAQTVKLRVLASQDNLGSAREIFFFKSKEQ